MGTMGIEGAPEPKPCPPYICGPYYNRGGDSAAPYYPNRGGDSAAPYFYYNRVSGGLGSPPIYHPTTTEVLNLMTQDALGLQNTIAVTGVMALIVDATVNSGDGVMENIGTQFSNFYFN